MGRVGLLAHGRGVAVGGRPGASCGPRSVGEAVGDAEALRGAEAAPPPTRGREGVARARRVRACRHLGGKAAHVYLGLSCSRAAAESVPRSARPAGERLLAEHGLAAHAPKLRARRARWWEHAHVGGGGERRRRRQQLPPNCCYTEDSELHPVAHSSSPRDDSSKKAGRVHVPCATVTCPTLMDKVYIHEQELK